MSIIVAAPAVTVRKMVAADFSAIAEIYRQGIESRMATFETIVPDLGTWNKKYSPHFRLVATLDNKIAGWCALTQVSPRKVFNGVYEISIYIHNEYKGLRIGSQLLSRQIALSEQQGIWTLQAGIFPENLASVSLHQKHGFRIVGCREKIGCLDGIWRDSLLLERRSLTIE